MSALFFAPASAQEALKIKIENKKAFFLAGGTVLNTWRKSRKNQISLISLHKAGLNEIKEDGGILVIGAMATMNQISLSPLLLEHPVLKELAENFKIISKNIRNMATLGGVIGSDFTRSDILPLLLVLNTKVRFLTEKGGEILPLEEYLYLSHVSPVRIILSVEIPLNKDLTVKTARFARSSNDLPVVKVACSYKIEDGTFKELKIASGGATERAMRLIPLETALEGRNFATEETKNEIKSIIKEMKNPSSDLRGSGAFKKSLLSVLLGEVLCSKERCSI